ncbi:uncharacterized protein F4812DRAFT_323128 [Daldinia caldariorum]|uniref:uncharacterized protein n=1 Tax=Daldinia caldariorum TaxID=326644 RepID=UPI002008435D|nr:uncharacterized protein F4812DRAFT_323128 [Daldinia caldariorum]KAI1469234.1 hypothetical protein F4812DRAFT_323128 [Daldinia caldariorum]
MCHKNIYTYIYPDGNNAEQIKHDLCDNSRHGMPCKLTKTFQHPPEYVRSGQLSPPGYSLGQFPPTPPLSSHSASDSEHSSSKGRSSIYINGEKVVDPSRRSSRRDKGERTGDRTVYVDSSPLSRTPPRRYSISRSTPSTPHEETIRVKEPRQHETSPDERERSTSSRRRQSIEVRIVNEPRHKRHESSKSSKSSSQDSDDDEERRRRRRNSHVRFEDEEEEDEKKREERKKKIQSEIQRANEDIANRPPVPAATAPVNTRYRRGSVAVDPKDAALVLQMDQLSLERERQANLDREKRRLEKRVAEQRKREREEEEAQRQRLRNRMAPDRMTPNRRATISDSRSLGRARQKIVYEDGRYYWE